MVALTRSERPQRPRPDSGPRPHELTSRPRRHRHNLAVPRRGHVLATVSEEYGQPVRAAVATLSDALHKEDCSTIPQLCLSRRLPEPGAWVVRPPAELLAWRIVSAWLTALVTRRIPVGSSLEEAAIWFFGRVAGRTAATMIPRNVLIQADSQLAGCRDVIGYGELLPYVLDPHGPGSRSSVRRDAATSAARARKRAEGIFYTPADVAAYMMRNCLGGLPRADCPPAVLDPACGTGVFLRAALETLRATFPSQTTQSLCESAIYGMDVDPWAVDAAAFVLLADCLADSPYDDSAPLRLWHRIRLNLACVDALTVDPPHRARGANFVAQPDGLPSGELFPLEGRNGLHARVRLSALFPSLSDKAIVVVGNPPYSKIGTRTDFSVLRMLFTTLGNRTRPTADVYPLFIEQMVRLTPPGLAAGTLVLPLSLASNVGDQFRKTRLLIAKTPGTWRFAFFDREPHALFGEDVRTRNSILFWHRDIDTRETCIATGPLRKWRGRHRANMFSTISFTPFAGSICPGIPKVDGATQADAFAILAARTDRYGRACTSIRRMTLANVLKNHRHTVFAGATAYNFLNVFLNPPHGVLPTQSVLSTHPLHAMEFPSRAAATAAFALLSSHLAYWWWHVTHDGFHVNAGFFKRFPIGADALSGPAGATLATWGEELWSHIRSQPIVSVNRGRTSLGYSPLRLETIRREIDQIVADVAGLDVAFVTELERFSSQTVGAKLHGVSPHSEVRG